MKKKSIISIAVAGAMSESVFPIEIYLREPMFCGSRESFGQSAQSQHFKNGGEPWKRKNKRGK